MDPNANLKEQDLLRAALVLEWGKCAKAQYDADQRGEGKTSIRRHLAELRASLTDHLNAGGLAPDWSAHPTAARYFAARIPDPLAGLHAAVARVTRPAKIDEIDTTE